MKEAASLLSEFGVGIPCVLFVESIYWCVSQDLSDELQSPPVMCVNGPEDKLFRSQSADITLSSEKERIKKMLSEG